MTTDPRHRVSVKQGLSTDGDICMTPVGWATHTGKYPPQASARHVPQQHPQQQQTLQTPQLTCRHRNNPFLTCRFKSQHAWGEPKNSSRKAQPPSSSPTKHAASQHGTNKPCRIRQPPAQCSTHKIWLVRHAALCHVAACQRCSGRPIARVKNPHASAPLGDTITFPSGPVRPLPGSPMPPLEYALAVGCVGSPSWFQ